jgi:N6-L-threonylcarbamoyladenine synthase
VTEGRQSGLGGLIILGIESSCDETAAAVVRGGGEVLANVVASQMKLHANYGGVVPELASREHLRNIVPVVRAAMAEAGVEFSDLDAIAVTEGPGLAGALLVGITYAKALAAGLGKPLVAVNHLEGHIHAVLMEGGAAGVREMPLLALVVSGGHTHLYLAEVGGESNEGGSRGARIPTHDGETVMNGAPSVVTSRAGLWRYRNVGRTVDDAAGEAFDKVAKLLGLGYPGGPWMDELAKAGDPRAVRFNFAEIKRRRESIPTSGEVPPDMGHPVHLQHFDFSFSGIKTAVLRYVEGHGMLARVAGRRAGLAEMLRDEPGLRPADALRLRPELF